MLELAKPVFRKRTSNVSIALATTHVLSLRNSPSSSGERDSGFIATPLAEIAHDELGLKAPEVT
jgi:hypothetical protein